MIRLDLSITKSWLFAGNLDGAKSELSELREEVSDLKEYNKKLNEEIVKLNNTIQVLISIFL